MDVGSRRAGRRCQPGLVGHNEPVVMTDLRQRMELTVSCENIREHMKAGSFKQ